MEFFARREDTAEIIEVITDFGLGDCTGLVPLCCGTMAPASFSKLVSYFNISFDFKFNVKLIEC